MYSAIQRGIDYFCIGFIIVMLRKYDLHNSPMNSSACSISFKEKKTLMSAKLRSVLVSSESDFARISSRMRNE